MVFASMQLNAQTTFFVDASMPDDSQNGQSWATAKKYVQSAIDISSPDDAIIVKYGTYNITSEIVVSSDRELISDDGTHTSFASAVPDSDQCIIDANSNCRVFKFTGNSVTNDCILKGFKIKNGNADLEGDMADYGGGTLIKDKAEPTITNCMFTNNCAGEDYCYGGAIACIDNAAMWPYTDAHVYILNNNFIDNIACIDDNGYGGAISAYKLQITIDNNNFQNNTANTAHSGRGGQYIVKKAAAP